MSNYNALDIYSFTNKTIVIPRRWARGDVAIRFGDNTISVDMMTIGEPLIIDTTDDVTITQSYSELVQDNSYRLGVKAKKAPGFPETITEDVYNKLSPSVSAMYQKVINEETVTVEVPVGRTQIPRPFLSEEEFAHDTKVIEDFLGEEFNDDRNYITAQISRFLTENHILHAFHRKISKNDQWVSTKFTPHRVRTYSYDDIPRLDIRYHAEPWTERSEQVLQKTKSGRPYADRRTTWKDKGPIIKDTLVLVGTGYNTNRLNKNAMIVIGNLISEEHTYAKITENLNAFFEKVTFGIV